MKAANAAPRLLVPGLVKRVRKALSHTEQQPRRAIPSGIALGQGFDSSRTGLPSKQPRRAYYVLTRERLKRPNLC